MGRVKRGFVGDWAGGSEGFRIVMMMMMDQGLQLGDQARREPELFERSGRCDGCGTVSVLSSSGGLSAGTPMRALAAGHAHQPQLWLDSSAHPVAQGSSTGSQMAGARHTFDPSFMRACPVVAWQLSTLASSAHPNISTSRSLSDASRVTMDFVRRAPIPLASPPLPATHNAGLTQRINSGRAS